MNAFQKVVLAAIVMTYLLIFVGGLVRVSGAGLGCPDWPTCFGRWFPPTSVEQLPPNVDPATFNITLAWIEYINRLIGVTTGFVITAVFGMALFYYRRETDIIWLSAAAFGLVSFEGWLGSLVVTSTLNPLLVTFHMLLALILVSLLIYLFQHTYYRSNPSSEQGFHYDPALTTWAGALWGLVVVEILLGTGLRSGLETISGNLPLVSSRVWLNTLSPVKYIHTFLGILMVVSFAYLWFKVVRKRSHPSPLVTGVSCTILVLVGLQIILGESMVVFHIPALIRLFHMWSAAWIAGLVMVLFASVKHAKTHLEKS
ncbi:MAG: heme A synthase [Fidelibacterota bacterium]